MISPTSTSPRNPQRRPPWSRLDEERIRWLRESLSEEYIAFNLAWLEDFLTTMDRSGIEVIMVEGHYHPAVANAATAAMKSRVLLERIRSTQATPGFSASGG